MIRHQAKEPTFTDVTGASISEKDNDEARTIVLLNFTSGLDYNQQVEDSDMFPLDASSNLEKGFDPDELQETIADAHDLLGKFGKIKKTFLAVIRSAEVEGKDGPIKGTIPEVCVTFVDTSSVLLALSALDGIILGGQMIQVRMLKQVEAVEDSRGREDDLPEKEDSHPPQFALSGVKVIVENLLGRGDVQELEELNEVITDIRYLCDSYGAKCSWRRTTLAVHLHTPRSLHIPNDLFSQVALKAFSRSTSTTQQSPKQLPLAMLWYSDLHAAVVACERFQGKIVEGRPLKFSFYDLRAYKVDIYSPEFCVSFPRHTSIAPSPVQASEEGNVLGVQLRGLNWVADGDSFSVHSFMHDFGIFLEMSVSSSARMRILDIVGCSSVYCARNPNRPNGQSHSVLFLGISLSECICLQSYIDGVTLNLKNVSNSQGSFQHLQTDDNSQTIKLLADVISTFAISPASDVEFFSKLSIEHNDSSFDQSSKVGEFPAIVSTPQIIATTGYGCVISVEGYVTNQDICSNIATGGITGIFPEEMKALKYDFLKLLKLHKIDIEHDSAAYCKRVHFISTNSFAMPSTPLPPQKDGVEEMDEECMNEKYDIAISFNRMMDAVDVMLTLDDIELGGEKLVSYLSEDRCSDDTIIFSFTPENSKTTVQELALPTPSVSKLPLHSTPSSNELPVASEEINTITKELLKKLATFQQRAKETDPLNAKLKERFVMGIKQVIKFFSTALNFLLGMVTCVQLCFRSLTQ